MQVLVILMSLLFSSHLLSILRHSTFTKAMVRQLILECEVVT